MLSRATYELDRMIPDADLHQIGSDRTSSDKTTLIHLACPSCRGYSAVHGRHHL
jgi:hypothetical protein